MKKIKVEQRAGGLTGLPVSKQETTGKTGPTHGTKQGIKGDTGFYNRLTQAEAHLSLEQKYTEVYTEV